MDNENNVSEVNATAVKRMVESTGWAEIQREILLMIDDLKELLVESREDDDRNRGRIDAFRTVLEWPEIVEQEAHVGSMVKILPKEPGDAD